MSSGCVRGVEALKGECFAGARGFMMQRSGKSVTKQHKGRDYSNWVSGAAKPHNTYSQGINQAHTHTHTHTQQSVHFLFTFFLSRPLSSATSRLVRQYRFMSTLPCIMSAGWIYCFDLFIDANFFFWCKPRELNINML